MPPLFTFGLHYHKNVEISNLSEREIENMFDEIDLPLDAIWVRNESRNRSKVEREEEEQRRKIIYIENISPEGVIYNKIEMQGNVLDPVHRRGEEVTGIDELREQIARHSNIFNTEFYLAINYTTYNNNNRTGDSERYIYIYIYISEYIGEVRNGRTSQICTQIFLGI